MAWCIGLSKAHNNFGKQTFFLFTLLLHSILISLPSDWKTSTQPQIPTEEATIEGRNVHPGLSQKHYAWDNVTHILLSSFLFIDYINTRFFNSALHVQLCSHLTPCKNPNMWWVYIFTIVYNTYMGLFNRFYMAYPYV